MRFTYDLNTNGCLILYAANEDRHAIAELIKAEGTTYRAEADALESLIANSDLDWIQPEEIAALTSAPILGLRDEHGNPEAAWGFMDYQVKSFLEDLRDRGKAVFVS